MANMFMLNTDNHSALDCLRLFFGRILSRDDIDAILVPRWLPFKQSIMPTLIADGSQMDGVDPLAPVFPLNAAKIVSRLSRKTAGGNFAVVLRPCEIRAFCELVKLKQGRLEEVTVIGLDCLGAFANKDVPRVVGDDQDGFSLSYWRQFASGQGTAMGDADIMDACKACEFPVSANADISIGLIGVNMAEHLLVETQTDKGRALVEAMDLPATEKTAERQTVIERLVAERTAYREAMVTATIHKTDSLEKLTAYLADCVNCYNCRVACPVCYCKECVFSTDVFYHEPAQYLKWVLRKGALKMPTDTVFYHLTRMAHMSTACVGCGQCSNACPNDIPVMELFRSVAQLTQPAFDYEPGRSYEEVPPLSEFRETEFEDIVGINP